MLERSVACSDLSSLHSYFSTGIVLLMSPLHDRCHLPIRLRAVQNLRGFSGYHCKRSKVRRLATHSFVKRSTLCRRLVRGGWGEQTGTIASLLLRKRINPAPGNG